MQHELHRVPVTAVAFFGDFLLAGEGHYLHIYRPDSTLEQKVRVFGSQAIHGIVLSDRPRARNVALLWGGSLLRSCLLSVDEQNGCLEILLSEIHHVHDWILDATLAPLMCSAALVTAHNELWILESEGPSAGNETLLASSLRRVVSGSNCILYSAHVMWLGDSECLVASGNVFGDIVVWSATLYRDNSSGICGNVQSCRTFHAHEGSVFGVQLSFHLAIPDLPYTRVLASCSDDRTIKLWDVSDLQTIEGELSPMRMQTGFSMSSGTVDNTPSLLASAMGHVSRIWHVRFLEITTDPEFEDPLESLIKLVSFGEDASSITWTLHRQTHPLPHQAYRLQQIRAQTAHAGKSIWSVAVDKSGRVGTGGADGAIATQVPNCVDSPVVEIQVPQQGSVTSRDNLKSYGFVTRNVLIATTNRGRVLSVDLSDEHGRPVVTEISQPLPGLQGYSVVATVAGAAFTAGTDGSIHAYNAKTGSLETVKWGYGKTAGLFACEYATCGVALLITGVVCSTARLVVLEDVNNVPAASLEGQLHVPQSSEGFVVTAFAYFSSERSDIAVIGSRNGSLAFYSTLDPPSSGFGKCLLIRPRVHGKEAITTIRLESDEQKSENSAWILTTGRDGNFAVHHAIFGSSVQLDLIHQLSLPLGPNVEGLELPISGGLLVWGFKRTHFVAYDAVAQREIMSVECGGSHRQWSYTSSAAGGRLVWTKASQVLHTSQQALSYQSLNAGGHGREIKAVAVSPEDSFPQLIATGAEDTDIKLFKIGATGFECLHTLRKHNTGIQHLQWSRDGLLLFSSGGFEEFFVWRITVNVPRLGIGVVCESTHPRSGQSDLRIMGFDIDEASLPHDVRDSDVAPSPPSSSFVVTIIYSDSTLRRWHYDRNTTNWTLHASSTYLTSCITHILSVPAQQQLITASTDGHIALWPLGPKPLHWKSRHRIHQNAIHAMTSYIVPESDQVLLFTAGDDNAIGITLLSLSLSPEPPTNPQTLLLPRAHAAAVTALLLFQPPATPSMSDHKKEKSLTLLSTGLDQRMKMWEIHFARAAEEGVEGVDVVLREEVSTAVADVSGMALCGLVNGGGGKGVVLAGVGMDVWRLDSASGG